jgi:hypothetical protein
VRAPFRWRCKSGFRSISHAIPRTAFSIPWWLRSWKRFSPITLSWIVVFWLAVSSAFNSSFSLRVQLRQYGRKDFEVLARDHCRVMPKAPPDSLNSCIVPDDVEPGAALNKMNCVV